MQGANFLSSRKTPPVRRLSKSKESAGDGQYGAHSAYAAAQPRNPLSAT